VVAVTITHVELDAAMRRAVLHLMERWQLRREEAAVLLGDGPDVRLAALLGVHRFLRTIFVDRARGYA
jgi:hypothetical protein